MSDQVTPGVTSSLMRGLCATTWWNRRRARVILKLRSPVLPPGAPDARQLRSEPAARRRDGPAAGRQLRGPARAVGDRAAGRGGDPARRPGREPAPRRARAQRRAGRADPGSTNGTWVNRRQLRAGDPRDRVELRDGDELRLGSVTLRFSTAAAGDGTAVREYAFGDVHGPVQTGSGQQYVAGRDQYVAGRDHYHDNSVRVEGDYDPWDELFRGRGVGRALMAIGGDLDPAGVGVIRHFIFLLSFRPGVDH